MRSTAIPTLTYRDAVAAIDFLVAAFGFARHQIHEEDGVVSHAELTIGAGGMVMVGSTREEGYAALVAPPGDGKPNGSVYVVVDDVRGHAERARAAGAEIVFEPTGQDYGGSNYTCRDPEGNLWNFGDYDPWAGTTAP